MNNNQTTQKRQRYTRRHRNSPNYARWYEIVNWACWITIVLGFVMFIVGLGLLGSPNDTVNGKDATIVWAVGLGLSVVSLILCFVLMWVDDDYESQQQSQMMNSVAKITPEEWQQLGNNMASVARAYQSVHKTNSKNTSDSSEKNAK